jgi:hypothetical protein
MNELESVTKKVTRKLVLLNSILQFVDSTKRCYEAELNRLIYEYSHSTDPIISNTNLGIGDQYNYYCQQCMSICLLDRMDTIYTNIKTDKCKPLTLEYNSINVSFNYVSDDIEMCTECNAQMCVDTTLLQNTCSGCGKCGKMEGTIIDFEVIQNKSHGAVGNNKHHIGWLARIQAQKCVVIDDKTKTKLEEKIKKDKTKARKTLSGKIIYTMANLKNTKCDEFREWLKEIGSTQYNRDVPYIRKIMCGVIPYQLSDLENDRVCYLLALCTDAYKQTFSDDIEKKHNPYIPYMIGKILEHMFVENTRENKIKRTLLECIHIQSEDTTQERDKKWAKVCEIVKIIKYRPTICSLYRRK